MKGYGHVISDMQVYSILFSHMGIIHTTNMVSYGGSI